ncbi:hypothetical protein M5E87_10730 [Flavonifractor plautii]|nr:hypothetical protein M5E87_10730 [Flavonifractor plautii]
MRKWNDTNTLLSPGGAGKAENRAAAQPGGARLGGVLIQGRKERPSPRRCAVWQS